MIPTKLIAHLFVGFKKGYCALYFIPSKAIDKTEFSTNQSKSLSVSMAFFTVFETVLSSISFVT